MYLGFLGLQGIRLPDLPSRAFLFPFKFFPDSRQHHRADPHFQKPAPLSPGNRPGRPAPTPEDTSSATQARILLLGLVPLGDAQSPHPGAHRQQQQEYSLVIPGGSPPLPSPGASARHSATPGGSHPAWHDFGFFSWLLQKRDQPGLPTTALQRRALRCWACPQARRMFHRSLQGLHGVHGDSPAPAPVALECLKRARLRQSEGETTPRSSKRRLAATLCAVLVPGALCQPTLCPRDRSVSPGTESRPSRTLSQPGSEGARPAAR